MNEFLDKLVGQVVVGGCPDCDAEQEVVRDPSVPGLYALQIRHDDTCPTYRRLRRTGQTS